MAGVLIMTLEEAVTDLTKRIMAISPEAVIRVIRNSSNEASIRAYAAAEHEAAIKDATWEQTFKLLTEQDLDLSVIFYDITNLPKEGSLAEAG
jgi:hypothetical protein